MKTNKLLLAIITLLLLSSCGKMPEGDYIFYKRTWDCMLFAGSSENFYVKDSTCYVERRVTLLCFIPTYYNFEKTSAIRCDLTINKFNNKQ